MNNPGLFLLAASMLTVCPSLAYADIPGCGDVLFEEAFNDDNFTSRGWYDVRPNADISTAERIPGSASSFECRFSVGGTGCAGGRPARHKFSETESVYLSFHLKFSNNWIGSGKPYHPHMFHFFTNVDDDFVSPANSHLTTYAEVPDGRAEIGLQDSKNVDTACIQRGNGVVVGCSGNFEGYPFTEQRSVASCNGIVGELDGKTCYNAGSYWYSARNWRSSQVVFGDGPPPFDKNNWHFVEVYMQLNSVVDGVGFPDGKIRWVQDGQTILSSDQILFRTGANPTMAFNQFSVAPYIGDGSPLAQTLWVDDLTVATARPDGCQQPGSPPQPPILLP